MQILVVAATRAEIGAFIDSNPEQDVLITGVGAPVCMYSLTKQLARKQYDLVIQAGIAGTFRTAYSPGEAVVVASEVFADLGILENQQFFTLQERGFLGEDEKPYTDGLLVNEAAIRFNLPAVRSVTVNTVSDSRGQADLFIRKFNADIESMEGAAFHYVCLQENVNFIQLRTISNFVGERIRTNWKIKEAIERLNVELAQIISKKLH